MTVADSLISDELLRKLVGVGHVDLLVGVPTRNHADTITGVIGAVEASFRTYFPRQRTVLINSDSGSTDDTVALVQSCCVDHARTVSASLGLRSTHRISAPYHGIPGKANIVQVMFAAADLLQATAIVILDPDVVDVTPQRVAALAAPIRDDGFDLVAPGYRRQPVEGLLVTQLLRPLVRATYGYRVREPLLWEFGCSGPFAAHCADQLAWDSETVQQGVNLWLTGTALVGGFKVGQARFGSRHLRSGSPRPSLPDVFRQVVASAFAMIDTHAEHWRPRTQVDDVPDVGTLVDSAPTELGAPDAARLLESFSDDVHNLDEILRRILTPGTFSALTSAADPLAAGIRLPDALWASIVGEFLVASHRGVMLRDHIIQALLPLYVARTGAFLLDHADSTPDAVEAALESLCVHFERARVHIVDRWTEPAER